MSDLAFVITNAGRQAIINAENNGTAPRLVTQCGVSATAVVPVATATALPDEEKRIVTISGDVVADDTIHLIVRDESADSYTVRSLALYLDDGTLFAIYGQADPVIDKAASSILLLSLDIMFADIDATSLSFGDSNFLNPPATTERQGVVELATSAEASTGTDAVRALTPQAAQAAVTAWLNARFGTLVDANILAYRGPVATAALNSVTGQGIYTENADGVANSLLVFEAPGSTGTVQIRWKFTGQIEWRNRTDNHNWTAWRKIWNSENDGTDSGLDADLLDGLEGAAFAKLAGAQFTGAVAVPAGSWFGFAGTPALQRSPSGATLYIVAGTSDFVVQDAARAINLLDLSAAGTLTIAGSLYTNGNIYMPNGAALVSNGHTVLREAENATWLYGGTAGFMFRNAANNRASFLLDDDGNAAFGGTISASGPITRAGLKVWDEGNDGALSGLDADLLDGKHAAELLPTGTLSATGWCRLPNGLVLQWGNFSAAPNAYTSITFPLAFPGQCFSLQTTSNTELGNKESADNGPVPSSITKTGASFWSASNWAVTCWWVAIGN